VFKATFGHKENQEYQTGRVKIDDCGIDALADMVEFLYKDQINEDHLTHEVIKA